MSPDDGAVLREISASVGRIEGQLSQHIPAVTERLNDHTRRIRHVEYYAWALIGAMTLVGWLLGQHLLSLGGK